jgi:hypothetical protein
MAHVTHNKFWMLLLDTQFDVDAQLPTKEAPRFIHGDRRSAEKAAEVLVREKGQPVYILESTWAVTPVKAYLKGNSERVNVPHYEPMIS